MLISITNTLTKLETEHEEKIQILFDAVNAFKDSITPYTLFQPV